MIKYDDVQDKYCGGGSDIHSVQSHVHKYKGGGHWPPSQKSKSWRGLRPRHLFCVFLCNGFERVNVASITTILVLHVCVIGQHVPRQLGFMFPRRAIRLRVFADMEGQGSLAVWTGVAASS